MLRVLDNRPLQGASEAAEAITAVLLLSLLLLMLQIPQAGPIIAI